MTETVKNTGRTAAAAYRPGPAPALTGTTPEQYAKNHTTTAKLLALAHRGA